MATAKEKEAAADGSQEPGQQQPKRRRINYACELCRTKKNRCDGERPSCGPCKARQFKCVYSVPRAKTGVSQEYVENLEIRNRLLEQQLALQRNNNQNSSLSPHARDNGTYLSTISVPAPKSDVHDGSVHPSSTPRLVHAASSSPAPHQLPSGHFIQTRGGGGRPSSRNPQDESADSNTQIGGPMYRMLSQDRQPKGSMKHDRQAAPDLAENSTEYFGETSTFDFMTKICSPKEGEPKGNVATIRHQGLGSADISLAMSSPSAPIFEGLVFGSGSDDPFGLPHRFVADRLVDAYFRFRHPLSPYLHEPSFRKRYERLWLSEDLGGEEATEANLAWFGLVNLVFTFGSDHAQVASRIPLDGVRFFKRAKSLVFSGLLQAGSIDLVQALLLMGQYLHGSLELNNCWTVVGLAIRTAQGLGLHLDACSFTSEVIERETRKRVWWGCFVIDRILSMKVGRPPTIRYGPSIEVPLPLAVDDEYLTNDDCQPPVQPPEIPSKLDFLIHAVPQCRLLEQICDMLYSRDQKDALKEKLTDTSKLLAKSIQLDGDLVAWQQALPAHLRPESQVEGWHFERQRSTLMMRFLNSRLLLHRQILLLYITRNITDSFQVEIIHCCARRCIIAAHDTISQVRLLHQRHLLHSWWHNSHYVFAALGVMLAFQTLDNANKQSLCLPAAFNGEQVIQQGTELLEEVGGQLHPIASRYLQSLRRMEAKLKTLSASRAKAVDSRDAPREAPSGDPQGRFGVSTGSLIGNVGEEDFGETSYQMGDFSMIFNEDFSQIESMFYSTDWFGQTGDWNEQV